MADHPDEADLDSAEAVVQAAGDGMRADRYVCEVLDLFPRSQMKTRYVRILVNGRPVKPSRSVREGDSLEVEYGPVPLPELEPEDIPLSVVFENESLLVIDKPQGMVVHPAQGNYTGTLAHAVLHHVVGLERDFEPHNLRPGIVHRLDKDTSGIIVVAKSAEAHEEISRQFRSRTVRKTYVAITKGTPVPSVGSVHGFIRRDPHNRKRFAHDAEQGKPAHTTYRVLRSFEDHAVVVLHPETGRTHQLRVHMQHLGHPILGDPLYARHSTRFPQATLMLHALALTFTPPGDAETRTFTAPLPARFAEVVGGLIRCRER
ncbi:MAG: RluA family pseudouridine synthase [Spirochaetaceae bacterium]